MGVCLPDAEQAEAPLLGTPLHVLLTTWRVMNLEGVKGEKKECAALAVESHPAVDIWVTVVSGKCPSGFWRRSELVLQGSEVLVCVLRSPGCFWGPATRPSDLLPSPPPYGRNSLVGTGGAQLGPIDGSQVPRSMWMVGTPSVGVAASFVSRQGWQWLLVSFNTFASIAVIWKWAN